MQTNFLPILLALIFLTSACGATPPQISSPQGTQPSPASVSNTLTSTPSPTPTRTSLPSATPTASITPLPAIPTFTPSFDVSTIVTVTPAPQAECPEIQADATINLPPENDPKIQGGLSGFALDALNSGMTLDQVVSNLVREYRLEINTWDSDNFNAKGSLERQIITSDLTGDGTPELIINYYNVSVLSCSNGRYWNIAFSPWDGLGFFRVTPLLDINKNGINELLIIYRGCMWSRCGEATIKEWEGDKFQILLNDHLNDPRKIYLRDIDLNGIQDFLYEGGIPPDFVGEYAYSGPWRIEFHAYRWNGIEYIPDPIRYDQPQYRFQAIQDADRAVLQEDYLNALTLYQEVIFNKDLKWWSDERRQNTVSQIEAFWAQQPTSTPLPDDLSEYPKLAAYAYYRIMLIHLVQGRATDAITTHNTLQEKFDNDPYGHSYVELAIRFWEAYQSTLRMHDGCEAAIQYTVEHPEILIPLGSGFYGMQSHWYEPEDICPFR